MSLYARWRSNPLPSGIIFLFVSFILLGLACGFASQIVITSDTDDSYNSERPIEHIQQHIARVNEKIAPLMNQYSLHDLAAPIESLTLGATEASQHLQLRFGFFQFCYDARESQSSDPPRSSDYDITVKECMTIKPSCGVNVLPIFEGLLRARGFNDTQIEEIEQQAGDIVDAMKDFHLIQDCSPFNASRAFAALSTIAAGLALVFFVLLWRRKIPLVIILITTVLMTIFAIIAMSVIISVEQNDLFFSSLHSVSQGDAAVSFGLAFVFMVLAVLTTIITTAIIGYEFHRRNDSGQLDAFSARLNPVGDGSISMYQHM